jgi:hypothetical protein
MNEPLSYSMLHILDHVKIMDIVLVFVTFGILGYGAVRGVLWMISKVAGGNKNA